MHRFLPAASFHFLGGYLYRKLGALPRGRAYFESCQKVAKREQLDQLALSCTYEKAWCFYLEENWEAAIAHFQEYLAVITVPGSAAYAGYQLAVALYFTEAPVDAIVQALQGILKWVRKHFSWDIFAERRSREYLRALKGARSSADMLTPVVRAVSRYSQRLRSNSQFLLIDIDFFTFPATNSTASLHSDRGKSIRSC